MVDATPGAVGVNPVGVSVAGVGMAAIRVRALDAGDRELYLRAVDGLSEATWLLRFGGPKRRLTDDEVKGFLDVGRGWRVALVAVEEVGGEIVGVGRYAPVDDGGVPLTVEAALVVSDRWQGRGVGRMLLDELLASADQTGAVRVVATSLTENATIARMLRHRGFRLTQVSRGVSEWSRRQPEPSPSALPRR